MRQPTGCGGAEMPMSHGRAEPTLTAPTGVRELVLVRHGESVGNVAAASAERAGLEVIDLETRDADTPLSPLGAEQAAALGTWLRAQTGDDAPEVVWCSPYVRALQTA